MTTAIAILTYNRLPALQETLKGVVEHCASHPVAVFEDCGYRDSTRAYLNGLRIEKKVRTSFELGSDVFEAGVGAKKVDVHLGLFNAGVAKNSNRALAWFMKTGCDHLCLLNDDLHVLGDFAKFYAEAHTDLGVGLFCFCDFTGETYQWINIKSRGYTVKLLPRMVGIMMSMTRKVVESIGYFDPEFGKFGEEHCSYTNRARFAGHMNLDGQVQHCLDVAHHRTGEPAKVLLKHQNVETSVTGRERQLADAEASAVMQRVAASYMSKSVYRPYCIHMPELAGAYGGHGIPVDNLLGSYVLRDGRHVA